jgi:hypothetical protein
MDATGPTATIHISRRDLEESIKDTEEFLEDVLASLHFKRVVLDYYVPSVEPDKEQIITLRVDRAKLAMLQQFLNKRQQ